MAMTVSRERVDGAVQYAGQTWAYWYSHLEGWLAQPVGSADAPRVATGPLLTAIEQDVDRHLTKRAL